MKLIEANYANEYKVNVKFDDGTEGTVDLFVDLNKFKDTSFYTLTDENNFTRFTINSCGNLEWYNGWDYCKDALYMRLKGVNIEDENEVLNFIKNHQLAV